MAEQEYPGASSGEGPRWRLWLWISALVLLVLFIALNSQEVTVDFLFAKTETPLIFALVISGLLGAVLGWLVPRVRRRD